MIRNTPVFRPRRMNGTRIFEADANSSNLDFPGVCSVAFYGHCLGILCLHKAAPLRRKFAHRDWRGDSRCGNAELTERFICLLCGQKPNAESGFLPHFYGGDHYGEWARSRDESTWKYAGLEAGRIESNSGSDAFQFGALPSILDPCEGGSCPVGAVAGKGEKTRRSSGETVRRSAPSVVIFARRPPRPFMVSASKWMTEFIQ